MTDIKLKHIAQANVPEFVRNEFTTFTAFLAAYHDWLDANQANIRTLIDVDTTLASFISHFKSEVDHTNIAFPHIDDAFLLRNIKNMYLSKGTEESYRNLFRLMYNKDVMLKYPEQLTLKPSDGKWVQIYSIFVQEESGDASVMANNIVTIKNQDTKRLLKVTVENTSLRREGGSLSRIIVTNGGTGYTNPSITFTGGGGLNATATATVINGVITHISIDNPGINYTAPPIITINDPTGSGATIGSIQIYILPRVFECNIDKSFYGNINVGDRISFGDFVGTIMPTINTYTVTDPGKNFRLGQTFSVDTVFGTGTTFKVTKLTPTKGIAEMKFISFGYGYVSDFDSTNIIPPNISQSKPSDGFLGTNFTDLGFFVGVSGYNSGDVVLDATSNIRYTCTLSYLSANATGLTPPNDATHWTLYTGYVRPGALHEYISTSNSGGYILNETYFASELLPRKILSANPIDSMSIGLTALDYPYLTGFTQSQDLYSENYAGDIAREFYSYNKYEGDPANGATISFKLGPICKYPGNYISSDGMVSDITKIQDSRLYQKYATIIQVDETLDVYKDIVKTYVHPAGIALFGEYNIRNDFNAKVKLQSLFSVFSIRHADSASLTDLYVQDIFTMINDISCAALSIDLDTTVLSDSHIYAILTQILADATDFVNTNVPSSSTQITVAAPYNGVRLVYDALWTASTAVTLNTVLKYGTNYYIVTIAGNTGLTGPTAISGVVVDNTATLYYLGTWDGSADIQYSNITKLFDFPSIDTTANIDNGLNNDMLLNNGAFVDTQSQIDSKVFDAFTTILSDSSDSTNVPIDQFDFDAFTQIVPDATDTVNSDSVPSIFDFDAYTTIVPDASDSTNVPATISDFDASVMLGTLGSNDVSGIAIASASNSLTFDATIDSTLGRFNYNRLTITGGSGVGQARTILGTYKNKITYSNDFTNSVWMKTNCTATQGYLDPFGGNKANLILITGGGYPDHGPQPLALDTLTFYAKHGASNWVHMTFAYYGQNEMAWFDLLNGVTGWTGSNLTTSIAAAGNGYYKCVVSKKVATSSNFLIISPSASDAVYSQAGNSVYIYGVHLSDTLGDEPIITLGAPALGAVISSPWSSNLLIDSEVPSNPSWANYNSIANVVTNSFSFINENSVYGIHYNYQPVQIISGTVYTFSRTYKNGTRQYLRHSFVGGGSADGSYIDFDLVNGVIINVGSIGNGTYNGSSVKANNNGTFTLSISGSVPSTQGFVVSTLRNASTNVSTEGLQQYMGDGVSGLYAGSPQFELGYIATPYIATTSMPSFLPDTNSTFLIQNRDMYDIINLNIILDVMSIQMDGPGMMLFDYTNILLDIVDFDLYTTILYDPTDATTVADYNDFDAFTTILPDATDISASSDTKVISYDSLRLGFGATQVTLGGVAQASTNSSLTLASNALVTTDTYKNLYARITGGAGAGQERLIVASQKNYITNTDISTWGIYNSGTAGQSITTGIDPVYGTYIRITKTSGGLGDRAGRVINFGGLSGNQYAMNTMFRVNTAGAYGQVSYIDAQRVGGGLVTASHVISGNEAVGVWIQGSSTQTGPLAGTANAYLWIDSAIGSSIDFCCPEFELGVATVSGFVPTIGSSAVGVVVDTPWSSNMFTHSKYADTNTWSIISQTSTIGNKVICTNVADPYIGQNLFTGRATGGRTFTISVDLWTDASQPTAAYTFFIYDGGVTYVYTLDIIISTIRQRYSFTTTINPAATNLYINARLDQQGAGLVLGSYYYAENWQFEESPIATPYLETITVAIAKPDATSTYFINSRDVETTTGTTQTSTSTSLTLDTNANNITDHYAAQTVTIASGMGVGQRRSIVHSVRNLANSPEDMNNWTMDFGGDIRTLNVGIDGDGNRTLDQLTASAAGGQHRFYSGTLAIDVTKPTTYSIEARQTASTEHLHMFLYTGAQYVGASFNLTTGAIITTFGGVDLLNAIAVNVSSGLWRCTVTCNITSSSYAASHIYRTDINGGGGSTGDGVNGIQVGRVMISNTASYLGYVKEAVLNGQVGAIIDSPWSTNLVPQSETLNISPWGGCAVTSTSLQYNTSPFWNVAKTVASGSESISGGLNFFAQVGQTLTTSVAILAGTSTQIAVGLYGANDNWGPAGNSTATIISGPGTLSQWAGGLWMVSGLSTTVPTLLSVTRVYQVAGGSYLLIYPDTPGSATIGAGNLITRIQVEVGSVATAYNVTTTAPLLLPDSTSTYLIESRDTHDVVDPNVIADTYTLSYDNLSLSDSPSIQDFDINNTIPLTKDAFTTVLSDATDITAVSDSGSVILNLYADQSYADPTWVSQVNATF